MTIGVAFIYIQKKIEWKKERKTNHPKVNELKTNELRAQASLKHNQNIAKPYFRIILKLCVSFFHFLYSSFASLTFIQAWAFVYIRGICRTIH